MTLLDLPIRSGDYVLLYMSDRKRWLVRASKKEGLHTHRGYVDLGKIIGMEYGSQVMTSLGEALWLLRPTITDFTMKGERKTQIVYPKDMGMMAAMTGISSGSVVIEAGTGSGALTTFLAHLVRPKGHVYSYEIRKEFMEVAKRNIEKAGLSKFVTIKLKDAKEGFDEKEVDVVMIDVGEPWSLVKVAHTALKGGGSLVAVVPTTNQLEKLVMELANFFVSIESMEIMVRKIEAKAGATRPSTRMIGHTAYLTFARKVYK